MAQVDLQSEGFEELLGEALRSGPGSPAWKQAVEALKDAGSAGEEYAMLCRARENLESGRQYRSIKAGDGFTRKLMEQIDQEPGSERRSILPTASVIATIAIIVIATVLASIAWMSIQPGEPKRTASELRDLFFVTQIVDAKFDSRLPEGFTPMGKLAVEARDGLRPTSKSNPGQQIGGGVYYARELPAEGVYAVESALELTNPASPWIAQLFVTDEQKFSADRGITSHELVCLVEAGQLRVILPDGKTVAQTPLATDASKQATIRLKLDADLAVIEHEGKTLWSGPHHLGKSPRHVGVRYLPKGGAGEAGIVIRSLRVMKP